MENSQEYPAEIAVGVFLELGFEPLILVLNSQPQPLPGFGWPQCTRIQLLRRQLYPGRIEQSVLTIVLEMLEWVVSLVAKCSK